MWVTVLFAWPGEAVRGHTSVRASFAVGMNACSAGQGAHVSSQTRWAPSSVTRGSALRGSISNCAAGLM